MTWQERTTHYAIYHGNHYEIREPLLKGGSCALFRNQELIGWFDDVQQAKELIESRGAAVRRGR
jgi:hypothetical protein